MVKRNKDSGSGGGRVVRQMSVDQFRGCSRGCGVVPLVGVFPPFFSLEHRFGSRWDERLELARKCFRECRKNGGGR